MYFFHFGINKTLDYGYLFFNSEQHAIKMCVNIILGASEESGG